MFKLCKRKFRIHLTYFSLSHESIFILRKADVSKFTHYLMKDRLSALFPSLSVRFCKQNDNALISKYAALEKTISALRGRRFHLGWPFVQNLNRCLMVNGVRHFNASYAASQIRPLKSWPHLCDLRLADPNPASQQSIHLLIRTDLYRSLLLGDLHQAPLIISATQKTAIGCIISGPDHIWYCSAQCGQGLGVVLPARMRDKFVVS